MNTIDIEKLNQLISRTDISGNDKVMWLEDFIDGREQQLIQDEFYSEEEVLPIIEYIQWVIRKIDAENTPEEIVRLLLFNRDKIEQFKKK